MDSISIDHAQKVDEKKKMKRRRRKSEERANNQDDPEVIDQTSKFLEIPNNGKGGSLAETNSLDVDSTVESMFQESSKLDSVSIDVADDKIAGTKKKRKRKSKTRANIEDELKFVDQSNKCLEISKSGKSCIVAEMGTCASTAESLFHVASKLDAVSSDIVEGKGALRKKKRKKPKQKAIIKDELEIPSQANKSVQVMNNGKSCIIAETGACLDVKPTSDSLFHESSKLDNVSMDVAEEKIVAMKKKRRRKSKTRANIEDEAKIVDQSNKCLEISNNGNQCITAEMGTCASTPESMIHEASKLDAVSSDIVEEKGAVKKKKRKKSKQRANIKDELEIVGEANEYLEIPNNGKSCILTEMRASLDVEPTSESLFQESPKLDIVSSDIVEEKGAITKKKTRRKSKKRADIEDELKIVDQSNKCLEISNNGKSCAIAEMSTCASTAESLKHEVSMSTAVSGDIVEGKGGVKKKKRKKSKQRANIKDELGIGDHVNKTLEISNNGKSCIVAEMDTCLHIDSAAESLIQESPKLDTVSIDTVQEKSAVKKKKRRNSKQRANVKDELEIADQANKSLEISNNGKSCIKAQMGSLQDVGSTAESLIHVPSKVDTVSTYSVEASSPERKKKRRKSMQRANIKDELVIGDQANKSLDVLDNGKSTVPIDIVQETDAVRKKKKRRKSKKRDIIKDELEIVGQAKKSLDILDNGKSCIVAEMGSCQDVGSNVESLICTSSKVDTVSTESVNRTDNIDELVIADQSNKGPDTSNNERSCIMTDVGTYLDVDSTAECPFQESLKIDTVLTNSIEEKGADTNRKKRRKRMKKKDDSKDEVPSIDQGNASNLSLMVECNGVIARGENSLDESRSQTGFPSDKYTLVIAKEEYLTKDSCPLPTRAPITGSQRILLILDINGLLADIVLPPPKGCKADINILRRAIFKRPYCDDFLKFCFETFDVGIWSSRSKKIIDPVVNYLLGNLKKKLLFCWDMSHSTVSKFKTLENRHKPLVCKDLRKLWEKQGLDLPWKKGDYNESNTLLIDDSPYKALLNPMHTAIFPNSYTFKDQHDNSLGPGGDLRVYLQDLSKTEDVKKYVKQHPFGQPAITDKSSSWGFYSRVLQSISVTSQAIPPPFSSSASV